jgi:hypothetical protein
MVPSRLLPLSFALILAACGGGGATPNPTSSSERPAVEAPLALSPSAIVTTQRTGQSTAVALTATIVTPANYVAGAVLYMKGSGPEHILAHSSTATASADVFSTTVAISPKLGPGKYAGHLTVQLCPDPLCDRQYQGSPQLLPYQIDITP